MRFSRVSFRSIYSAVFHRSRREAELHDEIEFHIAERADDLAKAGVPPEDAKRRARLEFGAAENYKEQCREALGLRLLDQFRADLRYALRQMRKSPGFTLAAVVSLALGLGANVTIFSFVSTLLLRPPSIEAPNRVVEIWNRNTKQAGFDAFLPLSYPDYAFYRDHAHSFDGLAAFDGDGMPVAWTGAGEPRIARMQVVSANFFSVLGVRPEPGRGFSVDEGKPGDPRGVIVISHAFWAASLGADPGAVGRTVTLNGVPCTIIGVAPRGFTGVMAGIEPAFWAPLPLIQPLTRDAHYLTNWSSFWLLGGGRLRDGIALSQARAELITLSHRIPELLPKAPSGDDGRRNIEPAAAVLQLVPEPVRIYVAGFTATLMIVVGMLLLLACANVANLFLARAIQQRRELAVRAALGATKSRLLAQLLMQTVLLALLAGGLGWALARAAIPAVMRLKPATVPLDLTVVLDWRVSLFTIALSIAAGVLFGVGPALKALGGELAPVLKTETAGANRGTRLRRLLVAMQVTLCSVLLIGAVLCVRSLMNARSIDPGFDTRGTALVDLDPGQLGYPPARVEQFYAQLVDRARALPGVRAAAITSNLPLSTRSNGASIIPEGQPDAKPRGVGVAYVSTHYFETLAIPVLRGREFVAADRDSGLHPVIINDAMARKFWPGEDPIGKRMRRSEGNPPDVLQVIGVVKTGKYRTLSEPAGLFMYEPLGNMSHATLVVRTDGSAKSLLGPLRRELNQLEPNAVPLDMETLEQYMAFPLFPARVTGILLGSFGLLALMLAVTGIAGVVSYVVSQRTREFGIRVALGATRFAVLRLVVGDAFVLVLAGGLVGCVGGFGLAQALSGLLYGIRPFDPITFGGVPLLLLSVALLASLAPAIRAVRIDPASTLRHE